MLLRDLWRALIGIITVPNAWLASYDHFRAYGGPLYAARRACSGPQSYRAYHRTQD